MTSGYPESCRVIKPWFFFLRWNKNSLEVVPLYDDESLSSIKIMRVAWIKPSCNCEERNSPKTWESNSKPSCEVMELHARWRFFGWHTSCDISSIKGHQIIANCSDLVWSGLISSFALHVQRCSRSKWDDLDHDLLETCDIYISWGWVEAKAKRNLSLVNDPGIGLKIAKAIQMKIIKHT